MKNILLWLGAIFILFIILIFAIAIQIYNTTPEQIEQEQITYNQETKKPLTRLESAERQAVQDWKEEVKRRKLEAGE